MHFLDGAKLSILWGIPFIGILLSIALFPLLARHFWHRHYGKVALFWSVALLVPLGFAEGFEITARAMLATALREYLPFIIILFALFTLAGGILVSGEIRSGPTNNTAILAIGTLGASIIGTTGASMILIRPLLRANKGRRHQVHVVIFFILLVSNIGGALTPLGDPPLFVGFLRGVDFFWTAKNLWQQTTIVAGILLVVFFVLDWWLARKAENRPGPRDATSPIRVRGKINFLLIAGIIAIVLMSAAWKPGAITVYGVALESQNLARDTALLIIALLSLLLTPSEHREGNDFSWEPIREVAILFAAIFTCIIPVIAMLEAGRNGPFASLLRFVTEPDGTPHEVAYFWLTGLLSAFLDNAPTYLVFFELAGGDAQALMGPLAGTLAAISMGAVYMGALTYIGNAPNFMVYAIAEERGVRMPNFFAYLLWASLVLVPLFLLLTLLPVAPILKSY
jgi:Na+/H+ antiporter NhaD/arsenite permease-like protein